MLAVGLNLKEIMKHWTWLELNLLPTLGSFDSEEEARQFVLCKVEGLLEQKRQAADASPCGGDVSNTVVLHKFHRIFDLPADEKLVNCKAFQLASQLQTTPAPTGRAALHSKGRSTSPSTSSASTRSSSASRPRSKSGGPI